MNNIWLFLSQPSKVAASQMVYPIRGGNRHWVSHRWTDFSGQDLKRQTIRKCFVTRFRSYPIYLNTVSSGRV
jgi:hypothetical protein